MNLKELRKEKGMSQAELASRCGITQTAISLLESGKLLPTKALLKAMCEELGVDHDALVEREIKKHEEYVGGRDKKMSQNKKVLDYMIRHGSISQREAVSFGCYRLSARIHNLREEGYVIKTENKTFADEYGRGHYAVYSLAGGKP